LAGFLQACPELVEGQQAKIMTKHKIQNIKFTLWNNFQIPQEKCKIINL